MLNTTGIIGMGEVGNAILNVFCPHYSYFSYDPITGYGGDLQYQDRGSDTIHIKGNGVDVLHICFPYCDSFVNDVGAYKLKFRAKYVVIHSTVPIGTSRLCKASHSPIRGIHPNLTEGVKTFPKFIGGSEASDIADYFRKAGLRVVLFDKQETTELAKLLDTEYYRVCIEFAKDAKRHCDYNKIPFHEVYTLFNQTYNDGYVQLGHPEYVRPVLQPIMTKIGGHCVKSNQQLMSPLLENLREGD